MKLENANILIIDDHRLVAEGIKSLLSRKSGVGSVSVSNSVRHTLVNDGALDRFDLIIIDLHMPTIDAFGFLRAVKTRNLNIPVIVISGDDDRNHIRRVFQEGAKGYISKCAPVTELLQGVSTVLEGEKFAPSHLCCTVATTGSELSTQQTQNHLAQLNDQRLNLKPIRKRQREILELINSGYPNSDIATVMGISESTVKAHLSNVFKTLNVKNRTQCVKVARDLNLIT